MNIYQKLAAVRDEVKYIQKTGYNSFHKYTYAKEGDYLEAIRPALQKQGLFCYPSMQRVTYHPDNKELCLVEMEFTFVNTDAPEERIVVPCSGQGSDKGDKAVYKGVTGCKKYMLGVLFLIESGDDAEADTDTDKRAAGSTAPSKPVGVTNAAQQANVTGQASAQADGPKQSKWRSLKTATESSEY